ncbi:MAG: hypothetical protein LBN10_04300 [Propionibacteriaceae bacterium]|nr:hypothetical protein [Propionibacteriaceae bacterium]
MVTSALQTTLDSLTHDERLEALEYLEFTTSIDGASLTLGQRQLIQGRDAEMDADLSLGIPWEEVNARLQAEFG